jgi:hypothetical protein
MKLALRNRAVVTWHPPHPADPKLAAVGFNLEQTHGRLPDPVPEWRVGQQYKAIVAATS